MQDVEGRLTEEQERVREREDERQGEKEGEEGVSLLTRGSACMEGNGRRDLTAILLLPGNGYLEFWLLTTNV
jgi:hypothetical protein